MTQEDFQKLFNTHWKWQKGVFSTDIVEEDGVVYYFGRLNSEFFDVAIPQVGTPNKLNLDLIKRRFEAAERTPSFYLTEELQKKGFVEYLIRNGFSLLDSDTWMVLDESVYGEQEPNSKVTEVDLDKFGDYYSVLSVVFKDFQSNEKYLEICKNSLAGKVKSENFDDFKSELYLIYDNDKPAAGGGMFYSVKGNFAYLHDAGTLEEFRGKGYQTDLIKYRANKALGLGINRIYSLTEQGEQSWKNMIKIGFNQLYVANILGLKENRK
jgi:hypothetical protein